MVSIQEKSTKADGKLMTSDYQPFCDMDIPDTALTQSDYEKLTLSLESRANRDLKFSDTTIEITSIELYEIRRFHYIQGVTAGVNGSYDRAFTMGVRSATIVFLVICVIFSIISLLRN